MLDLLETSGFELPQNLLMIIAIIGVIILVFVAIHIISAVRAWKVQRAIFDMQSDVKEIKKFLLYDSEHARKSNSNQDEPNQ